MTEEPPDDWLCLMCKTRDDFHDMPNDKYNENNTSGIGERELQICRRIVLELYECWPDCNSFNSVKELDFPQYHQLIKDPIALDVIKKRLGSDSESQYKTVFKFHSDIKRMFKNCRTFWENFTWGDKYIGQAKKLEDIYNKIWKDLQKPNVKLKKNYQDLEKVKKRTRAKNYIRM